METPELDRFYRDHSQDTGLLLVAVQDAEADVRAFMEDGGYDLPVLLDSTGEIANRYKVTAVPTAVIIDSNGKIGEVRVGETTADELESMLAPLR